MGARGDGARGEVRVGRGGGRRCRCACEEGEGAAGSPHRAECLSRVRQARKKLVVSRGAAASIAPGGDGFACRGDINGDRSVNAADLGLLIAQWGDGVSCDPQPTYPCFDLGNLSIAAAK